VGIAEAKKNMRLQAANKDEQRRTKMNKVQWGQCILSVSSLWSEIFCHLQRWWHSAPDSALCKEVANCPIPCR
jgi:hypothetical protein